MLKPIPAIDHSLLSPSGRISKRAREAALKRERERLFPPGYWLEATPTPNPSAEIERMERTAKMWEDLAARGMGPRKYKRLAAEMREKIKQAHREARPQD